MQYKFIIIHYYRTILCAIKTAMILFKNLGNVVQYVNKSFVQSFWIIYSKSCATFCEKNCNNGNAGKTKNLLHSIAYIAQFCEQYWNDLAFRWKPRNCRMYRPSQVFRARPPSQVSRARPVLVRRSRSESLSGVRRPWLLSRPGHQGPDSPAPGVSRARPRPGDTRGRAAPAARARQARWPLLRAAVSFTVIPADGHGCRFRPRYAIRGLIRSERSAIKT